MSLSEQLASAAVPSKANSFGRITILESLREHLQWAIELEHFTIPPYLCALYSLDAGRNPEATELVSSVLVEEMLHMTLAANLLNAVGGRPQLDNPKMLQGYPRPLPHSDRSLEISLFRFGHEAIETFLKIERPSPTGAPPEGDNYETIGQFYYAIKRGFRELSATLGEANVFSGDPARQVTDQHFYSGGGRIIAVNNLATALVALEEIVEQGEGANHIQVWDGDNDVFHPERDQVAHYYRFQELKLGRRYRRGDTPRSGPTGDPISVDWEGVRPMGTNPRTSDHAPGSPIRAAQEEFNQSYCALLQLLELAFDGAPQMLGSAIGTMYTLKAQAQALMQLPIEDGLATAGPTFEYVPSDRRAVRPQSAGKGEVTTMPINKSHAENIPAHTEAYYEELASQEEKYLDETEEEQIAMLTSDDPSPSPNGSSAWTETRFVQTSDGPENAMFCASSTNRSSAYRGRTQC